MTLVEVLVVISILGVFFAMAFPAVQAAREAARRCSCSNNMKQLGLAVYQYESKVTVLPSGGKGTDFSRSPPATVYDLQSVLTQLLSHLDQPIAVKNYDMSKSYRDAVHAPKNPIVAQTRINVFLCPSNPLQGYRDPFGYGQTDYAATAYTDIDPIQGVRNPTTRMNGALTYPAVPMAAISDGLSSTMLFVEDVGRVHGSVMYNMTSATADPDCVTGNVDPADCAATQFSTGGATQANGRAINRWADPEAAGIGVSGPPNAGPNYHKLINQNPVPLGGPVDCSWSNINCGPNDEPFSYHPAGCNTVFADGSVHFMADRIDALTLRSLITRDEGISVDVPE